jgi:hypothetical protein
MSIILKSGDTMNFGNDHKRQFTCFVCGINLETLEEFKTHVMEHDEGREWIRCPITYCQCPCRDLRAHFQKTHKGIPIPKNCQLKASVWFDPTRKKRKPTFAEGNFISKKITTNQCITDQVMN